MCFVPLQHTQTRLYCYCFQIIRNTTMNWPFIEINAKYWANSYVCSVRLYENSVICVLWFVYNIFFAHMVISPSIYKASCSFKWVYDKWPKVNSRYICFALKRTWIINYLTNCKHNQNVYSISLPNYHNLFSSNNSKYDNSYSYYRNQ